MAGRRNRRRRRRRLRAKLDSEASESSSPQSSKSSSPQSSGSSSDDRAAQRIIPLPNRQQQVAEEKPDLRRRTRDARDVRPFLLGVIRGYYIDAIARLPATELRTTLARGLLVGGHWYGPLHPVHNIILNSVWYAAAFPFRADPINVDVVTTEGINRLAHRSLDGLVAYLCHQCPDLSHDDALWHLALSLAALHGAPASVRGAVLFGRTELKAVSFQVAAQAARHPKPSALTRFVTSVLPPLERDVLSLLAGRRRLSSHDILRLSAMLQPLPLPDALAQQPCHRELSIRIGRIIAERRRCCRIAYQMFIDIADAALHKFARQTGARYRLHIIYGQSIVEAGDCCGLDQYFHINFMAWPKGKQTQSQIPVCFFAEAHNPATRNCSEEDITSCCLLGCAQPSPSHVDNCYACARIKRKIDHPNGEEHFGGHAHKTDETEDDRDCLTTIDVDYRFFDPDRDIDLVKWYAEKINRDEAINSRQPQSPTATMAGAQESLSLVGTMRGHNGEVTAIATPIDNSPFIVSSSRDKSVLVWDLQNPVHSTPESGATADYGVPFRRLTGHSHFVQDVVLSSDGQFALSGSWDGELRLWDLSTGVTTRRFVGHEKDVLSVAFSVDNRQIVSASRDKTIKLWNTLGECKYTIGGDLGGGEGHNGWVSCVRFSPNTFQPTIVSGSWDRTVKVWNLTNCKLRCTLDGHGGYVNAVAVSPDGSLCASGGKDGVTLLWDLAEGKRLYSLDAGSIIHSLCFSPNRYWLCAATQDSVKIWDLESKHVVQDLKPDIQISKNQILYCTSLSWSADGSTLYTGYTDGSIRVWKISGYGYAG